MKLFHRLLIALVAMPVTSNAIAQMAAERKAERGELEAY